MTDNLVVEYIRCKCTRYWYLDWNKKYHRKSLESFEEEVNGSGSRAWQCWHRLYLVPLQITLRHCLLHSARWLLPACPKTVESKTTVGPKQKAPEEESLQPTRAALLSNSCKTIFHVAHSSHVMRSLALLFNPVGDTFREIRIHVWRCLCFLLGTCSTMLCNEALHQYTLMTEHISRSW